MAKEDQEVRIKTRHGNEDSSVNDFHLSAYDFYKQLVSMLIS